MTQAILSFIVLLAFVAVLNAQSITASFNVTTAKYNYGYYTGTLYYSWDKNSMKLSFPNNDQYAELYIFNTARGYPSGTAVSSATGQFSSQYLYKSSAVCSCETTLLSFAMPQFVVGSKYLTATGNSQTFNGIVGTGYTTASGYTAFDLVTDVWFASNNNLLAFKMSDGRLFTLDQSSYSPSITSSSVLAAPTNCKCGKPMDVVISLDRTGSIDYSEWVLEKAFTRNMTRSFDYGDLKTNLAIINWNYNHWVTIPLTAGTTQQAVSTAVEAMGCCSGSSGCCCCGTDIGGGIYSAGVMLLTSNRPTASKIVILLTDGCQNHRYLENQNPPVVACACSSESACASNLECIADITHHYDLLKMKIPSAKVIVVGVGEALCTSQLLLAAGNIPENVYSTSSWDLLSNLVTSLSATACTVDDDLCSGCCGFCSCGQCITPTQCNPPDLCTVAAPDPSSGGCCSLTPKTCSSPDPCSTASCDPTKGCILTPKPCRPNTTCTYYACDSTDGVCKPNRILIPECMPTPSPVGHNNTAPPPPPPPNCYKDLDCSYGDKCLDAFCIAGNCVYNTTKCPTNTSCVKYVCVSNKGCIVYENKTDKCDDLNACTRDWCDPKSGCRFDPITCPPTGDICIIPMCSKSLGCFNTTNNCKNFTYGNCTVGNCRNHTCYADNVCLPPPPPSAPSEDIPPAVVLGSSLGAAAVVAIVVCAIIALCGIGGGAAFAISQAGAGGGAAATQVNPLYKPTGHAGQNPLYRA